MNFKKSKYELVDYIFWFLFLLMTNPGGIFQAFGEDTSTKGSIDMRDLVFVAMFGCYIWISINIRINDKPYGKIIKHLVIFALYYFIIFGFFVPIFKQTTGYELFTFLKKSRKTVYSFLMFVMVYPFYLRSYVIFYKTLIVSSIVVLALFFITFFTGLDLLPIETANRGFIDIDRIFIKSEGLMLLLIPMGVVLIVFKSKIKWKKLIVLAFTMMFINYILSITRRDIIGTLVYFIIASVLFNYLHNKPLVPIKKMLSVTVYIVILGFFISFSFPKYYQAGVVALQEAMNVVTVGETSNGKEDVRMGLGKDFMQNLIINNIWFGTGFDDRWRGSGDKEGFETSDYPFLSAIAMTGIFGLLVFLPIYIVLVRLLIYDIKFLKKHKINYLSFEFYALTMFIIYYIYSLLQYMNWFVPVSLSRGFKWYVYLALYLASREIFYNDYYKNNGKLKLNTN